MERDLYPKINPTHPSSNSIEAAQLSRSYHP
jgi:hypothetical protein